MAQLVGHHPADQKVTSSIPGRGTCLGCSSVPGWGLQEAPDGCFSPSLSPSLPLSLKKLVKNFKKKKDFTKVKRLLREQQASLLPQPPSHPEASTLSCFCADIPWATRVTACRTHGSAPWFYSCNNVSWRLSHIGKALFLSTGSD